MSLDEPDRGEPAPAEEPRELTDGQRIAERVIAGLYPLRRLGVAWMPDESGRPWIAEVTLDEQPIAATAWEALAALGLPMAGCRW